MRKQLFAYFRQFVALWVVCSMLIASMPLNSYAAQDAAGEEKEKVYITDDYTVTFTLDTVWNSGYNVSVVIQNTGNETISDWYMYLKYNVEISNMWNASVYETASPYMVLTNAVWNKDVYSNGTAGFGYTGNGEFPGFPESVKVTSGYDPTAMEGGNDDHGDDGGDTPDDGADTDGDGLTDTFEEAIGSDPELIDTDGDGLSDYQELYLTLTDPTVKDTDGDGVLDPNEDIDEDGLGNLDELIGGTDPCNPDTDRDDLNDYDEVHVYGCDPLNYDSDGDGLCDGDDVLLGFSPTMPDTDLNGILDSAEKVYQTTENDFAYEDTHGLTSVSVSLNVSGNIDKEIEITNLYEFDAQSRDIVGLIGAPIEITCDVTFETAMISFSYDESALGDTSEENLSLMWYDEENHWYQILDQDCVVDPSTNTVSYTTTHFSEYCLVDKLLWFNTWNEDIEYPEDEPTELTYHPTQLFVIKDSVSGSTDEIELVNEIKNTLDETSNVFEWYTEADIIMESGRCKHWDPGSYYGPAFREYYTDLGYLITDGDGTDYIHTGFNGIDLDSTLNSIIYACDKYPDHCSYYNTSIILISGRNSSASDDVLKACADRGIRIYTIDIRNDVENASLKNLSDKTNGNHYYGEVTQNPTMLVNSLAYVMNGFTSYGSDSDGDGLLDKYETYGVRTIVGKLIKTDPDDKDSDDDNLTDYEELGMVYDLNLYIGFGVFKNCRFVIYHSNPTKLDSDEDGLTDDVDPHPLKKEYVEYSVSNVYSDLDYLNVNGLAGGNQSWWGQYHNYPSSYPKVREYFNESPAYRMHLGGCGVIAMTDLELYFLSQNPSYSSPYHSISIDYVTGSIEYDDYIKYAEYNRDSVDKYFLGPDDLSFKFGAFVGIASSFQFFLQYNDIYKEVFWNGYNSLGFYDEESTLIDIKRMISENFPVVFSYDTYFNHLSYLELYYEDYNDHDDIVDDILRTINRDYHSYNTNGQDGFCTSHYMTIIGYIKYINDDGEYDYLLKVVSWGKIYYVRYDDYSKGLNLTQNILVVR